MPGLNWDRERRDRPRRLRGADPIDGSYFASGRAPKGPFAVSFSTIAVLITAIGERERRLLGQTSCGGVRTLVLREDGHEYDRADARRCHDAEMAWLGSLGGLKSVARAIAHVADELAQARPELASELWWLAATARRSGAPDASPGSA